MLDKQPEPVLKREVDAHDVQTLYGDIIRDAHGGSPVLRTTVLQTLLMYNQVQGDVPAPTMPRMASMDEDKMKMFLTTMVYPSTPPSTSPPFNRPN